MKPLRKSKAVRAWALVTNGGLIARSLASSRLRIYFNVDIANQVALNNPGWAVEEIELRRLHDKKG